jgi:peptide/nickel transport system substrate-binding protein
MRIKKLSLIVAVLMLLAILAACGAEPETIIQEVQVEVTRVVTETEIVEGESVEVTRVVVETETIVEEVQVTAVPEEEMDEPMGEPPSEPQSGGDVRVWQPNGWPEQSWPHRSNWESSWAISPMAETLFFPLPDGTMEPILGESVDISDDGLVYTLHLREGVTWHDGEPFTAEDVVYSIHVRMSPDLRPLNGLRQGTTIVDMAAYHDGEAESITGIEALDDHTVQFTLASPDAGFARLFLGEGLEIIPEHIVSQLDIEAVNSGTADYWYTNPIGTGPYQFVEYVSDQYIEYARYDDYWGGTPGPDRLFMEISTAEVALVKLQRGELHLANPIQATELARLEGVPSIDVLVAENSAQWYGLEMNPLTQDGLWRIPEAKQAFLYSIDRQAYVDSILQGQGTVRHSFFDGTPYACPDMTIYDYQPELATQMWSDLGVVPSEVTIDMMSWQGLNARRDLLPIAQQFLNAQGFIVNVDFIDNSLIADYREGNGPRGMDWDFHVLLLGPSADPGVILPFISPGSGANFGYRAWPEPPNPATGVKDDAYYYEHPDLPDLLAQAQVETDPEARIEIYQQIDCIWNEEHPAFAIASPSFLAAKSTALQGVDWTNNAGLGFWTRLFRPGDFWVWDGS